jgi:hypothetical protein
MLLFRHSHSIVLSDDNALIFHSIFSAHGKEPAPNPSKIRALEFKGEFRRFGNYSVSRTIDDNRSIFQDKHHDMLVRFGAKNTISLGSSAITLSLAAIVLPQG